MSPKNKRMVIDRGNRRSRRSSDMCKHSFASRIRTYTTEVCVVQRRLSILVESGMFGGIAVVVEVSCGRGIPSDAEAINIEEAVTCCNFMLGRYLVWIVGEEFREVAKFVSLVLIVEVLFCSLLVDLFGESMGLDELEIVLGR